ncbi:MAG: hypothetical protein AABW50_04370 [Nanoarchaeota archaeon]
MGKEYRLIYDAIEDYNANVLQKPNSYFLIKVNSQSATFELYSDDRVKWSKSTLVGKVSCSERIVLIYGKGKQSFFDYLFPRLTKEGLKVRLLLN